MELNLRRHTSCTSLPSVHHHFHLRDVLLCCNPELSTYVQSIIPTGSYGSRNTVRAMDCSVECVDNDTRCEHIITAKKHHDGCCADDYAGGWGRLIVTGGLLVTPAAGPGVLVPASAGLILLASESSEEASSSRARLAAAPII